MKANRRAIFRKQDYGYQKLVGGIVALLLVIIIGIMVYFETMDAVPSFDEQSEIFTGYTSAPGAGGSNASIQVVQLRNSPVNTGNCNVTTWNNTVGGASFVDYVENFGLNGTLLDIPAGASTNFTQINVTYTSNIANTEATSVTPIALNVYGLLPIVALVLVASIMMIVILGFGGNRKGV